MHLKPLITTTCLALLLPAAGHAMPLKEALAEAYTNNPGLKADRKRMEAEFERLPGSYSGFLPSLSANYERGHAKGNVNNGLSESSTTTSKGLSLSQPIFRGGKTYFQVSRAEDAVQSAKFALITAEQRTMLEAVDAYLNLAHRREVYELSQNNEKVLDKQLNATNERFELGETTRTDVAQSKSRLASATSDRITAHGEVMKAESEFRRVFQIEPPKEAAIPKDLPELPENLEVLITQALEADPALKQAYFNKESAEDAIGVAAGDLLPTVTLDAGTNSREGGIGQFDKLESNSVTMNVRVPLYQGGAEYAELRRTRKTAQESNFRLDQERQDALNRATTAWEELTTAKGAITARQSAVDSAKLALEGVRQEQDIGSRTVLDVLDAEQELFRSRVNLIIAKRNYAFAAYQVLASTGKLTAEGLALEVERYDPQEKYNDVKYKIIGF